MFFTLFASRILDQGPPHRFCCRTEEMTSTNLSPSLRFVDIHESHVGFVNKHRGLQGLARLFMREFAYYQLAELLTYQWQQLLGRGWIALLNSRQDSGDVTHRRIVLQPIREYTSSGGQGRELQSNSGSRGNDGRSKRVPKYLRLPGRPKNPQSDEFRDSPVNPNGGWASGVAIRVFMGGLMACLTTS
jgi:hypothetical protein